jgi:hypothetical protein
MPYLDCIDTIEIKAPASLVYRIVSNYPGWKDWLPIYNCTLLNKDKVEEGVQILHEYGYKPLIISRFVRVINKMVDGKELQESYIGGNLRGEGRWKFIEKNGVTTTSYHCKVRSHSIFTHISFLLLGNAAHSNVYKSLLIQLKQYCES